MSTDKDFWETEKLWHDLTVPRPPVCPNCGAFEARVVSAHNGLITWMCDACDHEWQTDERKPPAR